MDQSAKQFGVGETLLAFTVLATMDVVARLVAEFTEFDRMAFKAYYHAQDGRFEKEFFTDEHRERVNTLAAYVIGHESANLEDDNDSPASFFPESERKDYIKCLFGIAITSTSQIASFHEAVALFKKKFPGVKDHLYHFALKKAKKRFQSVKPLTVKIIIIFMDDGFEKMYDSLPLITESDEFKKILPRKQFVSAYGYIIKKASEEFV